MITFLHLHKCGGTYVHNTLNASFPQARFAPRDGAGRILFPAPSDNDVIISGHLSAQEIRHRLPGERPIAILLREPLERLLSHYYFLASYEPSTLTQFKSRTASQINKATLSQITSSPRLLAFFKNYYLRILDPEWHPKSTEKPCMSRAIEFLEGCHAIGITSRMREFLATVAAMTNQKLCHETGSIFGNRRDELASLQGFRQTQRENLSPSTIKLLNRAVRKDRVLYNIALSRCI